MPDAPPVTMAEAPLRFMPRHQATVPSLGRRSMMVALAMPAALAHHLQAVAAAGALEFVEQRRHQLGARAAERVAEGDGATVDVHLVHVGAGLLLPRRARPRRTPR